MEGIMQKIYFIRHGETEWNKLQKSQGSTYDIELSQDGIHQAEFAALRLKNEKIDLFYSSHLKRAFDTCKIIADMHSKEVVKCREFREINFGCFEGLKLSELKEKYTDLYTLWFDNPLKAKIPSAENLIEIRERSIPKLNEIIKNNPGKNILIVSHGITIKVMIASIMGIDLSNIHKLRQDNTGITVFNYNNSKFELALFNDTCHLKER